MKVAKQKAPLRKEPFPLLNEWKVSTNSVDLHPKLAQLSKLVNEDGLTWDQQVTILRKLEKDLSTCMDQSDQQLRDQIQNVLQPVVCEAYFLALENLSKRYLVNLIKICSTFGTNGNSYFADTYKRFLEGDSLFSALPVGHLAITISNTLEYDIGVDLVETYYKETLNFLLSFVKRFQAYRHVVDSHSDNIAPDNQQWPYNRSNETLLADVQYILKAILAVLARGSYEENLAAAAIVQNDDKLVHEMLQTTLDIFGSEETYNVDCLQVAGMIIVSAINVLGDSAFVLELLTEWFIVDNHSSSTPASKYAIQYDIQIPDKLTGSHGWKSPESPMLMIIRGMISNTSVKSSLLQISVEKYSQSDISSKDSSPLNLLQFCFQATSIFCCNSKLEPQCKVIAFDAVTLWLQKIKSLLKMESSESLGSALQSVITADVRETLIMYVWSHWDDLVDAIQHKVKHIFELLLEVLKMQADMESNEEQYEDFVQSLLAQLLAMDWHRKVKYAMLALLLPSLSTESFLEQQPDFISRSLQAMDNMVIQPRVSALLGQFLEKRLVETVPQYRKNKTQRGGVIEGSENREVSNWVNLWLPPVLCALSSPSDILRRNVSHFVLMPLLEFYPPSLWRIMYILQDDKMFGEIVEEDCRQYKLNAFVSLMRIGRKLDIIDAEYYTEDYETQTNGISLSLLRDAMDHADAQVRADVLGLICESKKSGSYITVTELQLLEDFLPLNLNSTSPEFRQILYSEITKIFTKLRGNLYAQHRKLLSVQKYVESSDVPQDKKQLAEQEMEDLKSKIDFSRGFLHRLIALVFASLYPGSSFQRAFTTLRIMTAFVKIFGITEVPTPEGFLGKPIFPFSISIATEQNTKVLIGVLMDSYDQNRNLAFNILLQFPCPLPGYQQPDVVQRLLWWGLEKVRSKRAGESDSGAMVLRLLFRVYIMEAKFDLEVEEQKQISETKVVDQSLPSGLRFAWKLTHLIEKQLSVAKDNILLAAEEYPMHGTLLALRYLFQELEYDDIVGSPNGADWKALHERIVSLACEISDVVLGVLSNPSPEGNMPASFQEIEEAIDDILEENEDGDNDTTGSPKHQVILSSCWRAIKEASTLLEAMISRIPMSENRAGESMISDDHVLRCGNLLRTLLMCIRHRGAFSAVYPAYISLCSRLLKSSNQKIAEVPLSWLEENIQSISESSISVTRRSAGLPLCIMAIISSETSGRKSMLHLTMQKLIQIASAAVSPDANQTVDTPQVHAYNIMRQIFMDSKLGNDAITFAEDGFHLAIGGFSSASWAIRNCSVMLFSTLLQRTLGVKKTRDEHNALNLLTATEFFTRFPQLRPYLVDQLSEAVRQLVDSGDTSRVHPGLYPILTLLSRLQPSTVDSDTQRESLSSITPLVLSCSRSTIYKTREMAARALAPLVPSEGVISAVVDILKSCDPADQNQLHGKLLQCQYLLRGHLYKGGSIKLWTSVMNELPRVLLSTLRRLLVLNICPITAALLLDIILEFFIVCDVPKEENEEYVKDFDAACAEDLLQLRSCVAIYCKHYLLDATDSHVLDASLVGLYLLRQKQAEILTTLFLKNLIEDLAQQPGLLVQLLSIDIYEVRLNAIEIIRKLLKDSKQKNIDRDGLRRKLSEMIYEQETHLDCFRNAVLLLTEIDSTRPYLDNGSMPFSITDFWFRLVHQMQCSKNQSTQEAILPLIGALLTQILHTQQHTASRLEFVKTWSATFMQYSDSNVTLPLREANVASLSFIAPYIFNNVEEIKSVNLTNEMVATNMAIVQLLQDDDVDVRQDMAAIVSKAIGLQMNVDCEKALEIMYQHMLQNYSDSPSLHQSLKLALCSAYPVGYALDLNDNSKVLFEQESANIYRENLIDAQWAAILLNKLTASSTHSGSDEDTKQSLSRVSLIIKAIQETEATSYGPFGMTLRHETFEFMYDSIMLANVQLQLLANSSASPALIASVSELHAVLSKNPPKSLHPILRAAIYDANSTFDVLCRILHKEQGEAEPMHIHPNITNKRYFLTKCADRL